MKKNLITSILICMVALLPSNAFAIARIDEDGKVITDEPKDGEYTITVAPDTGEQEGSVKPITPEEKNRLEDENDKAVSSDDLPGNSTDSNYQDDIYTTTGIQEDAELYATRNEKENNILLVVISSVLGLSVGSVGTYLFLIKRK